MEKSVAEFIGKSIAEFVGNAEKIGSLSTAAVLALVCLVETVFIFWKMRAEKQASESAWAARIEESKADGMIANAIEKMSDQIKELRFKIRCVGEDDDKAG